MSAHFDARKDSSVQRAAMRAYVDVLLENALPPMRLAARGCGYALTVHGSLARDIDLLAVPWVENAQDPSALVKALCGVLAGLLGRATVAGEPGDKPHGRKAYTIITSGDAEIDLSIMPLAKTEAQPHD